MGPCEPVLHQTGASVLRDRLEFESRHPEVTIIRPGQTESGLWEADWPGRGEDKTARYTCAGLLIYLKARFDAGHGTAPDGKE